MQETSCSCPVDTEAMDPMRQCRLLATTGAAPMGRRRFYSRRVRCLLAMMLLPIGLLVLGCASRRVELDSEGPSAWANSVMTAAETARVVPPMSITERLAELSRAKEAAYGRLVASVFALRLAGDETIESMVTTRPSLRRQVEEYVRRTAVINSVKQLHQQVEIQASVVVGTEFLELLRVPLPKPPAADRNAPSTGIMHPY